MKVDGKKPGVAFWATVVVVAVLVAYPLSFGPACWITSRTNTGANFVPLAYRPVTWIWERSPQPVAGVLDWYARVGSAERWEWVPGLWISSSAWTISGWSWCEMRPLPTPVLRQMGGPYISSLAVIQVEETEHSRYYSVDHDDIGWVDADDAK